MATEVKIPVPDPTTEEVRIVKWCKSPGQPVTKGEVLLEIETDKAVMEVEAVTTGVLLKQLSIEEDIVPVGSVIGYIGAEGETAESGPVEQAQPKQSAETVTPEIHSVKFDSDIKVTPVARKLAAKHRVDLAQIQGTGCRGKVTRGDVEKFTGALGTQALADSTGRIIASPNAKRLAGELGIDLRQVTGTGPNGRITGDDVQAFAETKPAVAEGQPVPGTVVPMTKMRRAIGLNLQSSSRDTPHFNVTMSIDMTDAMQMRSRFNESRPKDKRLSVNDIVVKACAEALKQYPAVNSRLEGDNIHYLADINIGIATAVEAGLVVPVLMHTDKLDWDQLISRTKQLAQQARSGKIIGAGKGSFTISNLGMFGVDQFTAIINPPESAILAVGAVKNEVVDIGQGIGIRSIMKVTLCSDHRVIDGALAAGFLQFIKMRLEEIHI
ncbi:MAG: 2-oxo acid dehydrogenase subunit E2 [Planctomycetota bacterium]|jgi:pyruvate dehydrogenase E2 component (dihydrolipoamide acetyltransferase)